MSGYLTAVWLMIIFSFLSLLLVHELRNRDRNNIIWTYLLWMCSALTLFAVSRSAGHILKQALHQFTTHYVHNLLTKSQGNVTRAARYCGPERQALQQVMRRYQIKADPFRK